MIYHLLYRSFAHGPVSDNQLKAILKKSQENNLKTGITGLLLYKDKIFMQLLEGEENEVIRTFSRIVEDKRHLHPEVLLTARSEERLFPTWNMGLIPDHHVGRPLNTVAPLAELAAKQQVVDRRLFIPFIQYFIKGELNPGSLN